MKNNYFGDITEQEVLSVVDDCKTVYRKLSSAIGGWIEVPLFKGLSSKSTPKKAIAYITREDKAEFVSVRNLFEDEDYAEQFADTINTLRSFLNNIYR